MLNTPAMRKIPFLFLLMCLFAFSDCKKKSSGPSIVGKWAMTDISGTVVSNFSSTSGQTYAYTYNSSIKALTETISILGSTTQTINTINIATEEWTFNSDGTYSINETFAVGTDPATTSNATGTWEYLSNTRTNNGVILAGYGSEVISAIAGDGLYVIESIGDKLVLKKVDAYTNSNGTIRSTNITITLAKQ